jgi:hypothetical protein
MFIQIQENPEITASEKLNTWAETIRNTKELKDYISKEYFELSATCTYWEYIIDFNIGCRLVTVERPDGKFEQWFYLKYNDHHPLFSNIFEYDTVIEFLDGINAFLSAALVWRMENGK